MYFHSKFKIHKLIGEKDEAFYQLGLIDKNFLQQHFDHLKQMTNTGNKVVDTLINQGLNLYSRYAANNLKDHLKPFTAYMNAQDQDLSSLTNVMIYPEIMTGLSQFLPLNFIQLACSSIFYRNEDDEILHLRVLDFPLHETYTNSDRVLFSNFNNEQKVISLGPKGMPLHAITAYNESGISMSVHQKFDQHFNPNGTPILIITDQLITKGHDLEEIKKLAKQFTSMGSWGLHFSDSKGNLLSIEYARDSLSFKEHQLEKKQLVYINNQLFDTPYGDGLPASINMYNHQRDKFFNQIKKKIKKRKSKITHKNFIEIIEKLSTENHLKTNENIPIFTPSSVQISCINLTKQAINIVHGPAPKTCENGQILIEDVFQASKITFKENNTPNESNQTITKGKLSLIQAQVAFDYKNIDQCYHHLQMAMDYLEGTSLKKFAEFYFISLNIFHLKNRKSLSDMIVKLKMIHDELPEYLQQQSVLMQLRVQLILGLPYNDIEKYLEHPLLIKIWENEKNFMGWALQPILRKTALLRIDMFDIIYLHSRCEV